MLQISAKTMISLDADGVMQFDSDAIKKFRCQGIEFVAFTDLRTGRTAMRCLSDRERDALELTKPDFCAEVRAIDRETPREYLRAVGIKIRKGRKYEALLTHQGIVVTVS
jgi:hypothetical protein